MVGFSIVFCMFLPEGMAILVAILAPLKSKEILTLSLGQSPPGQRHGFWSGLPAAGDTNLV